MLTDREQSYYAELFQTCDVDQTGKKQVSDLFRSSGLSQDVLLQITELCGAKRLGHFGRSQFYIALKLIAAAQSGFPVSSEILNQGDIPLPKFHKVQQTDQGTGFVPTANVIESSNVNERQQGQLPPPPKKSHVRSSSGQFRPQATDMVTVHIPTAQMVGKEGLLPDTVSPPFSPNQSQMSTNPQSPPTSPPSNHNAAPRFPTNQPATSTSYQAPPTQNLPPMEPAEQQSPQKGTAEWARFESDDEKHGLLGQGKKEWDDLKLPEFDSSSYSSDTDSVEDVWSINDEQRDYYVKQFQNIEPDINGHISGHIAKEFFEKSKLSNYELSRIWNLSDLNKDGALSLEEFCIAMHLVVLRRNEIEIPERLPFSLMPYNAFTNEDHEPFAADLPHGSTLKAMRPASPPEGGVFVQESPQISSSEVSSPSITPANFDFEKPEPRDDTDQIIHPKARRLSPEMLGDLVEPARPEREPVPCLGDGSLHDTENTAGSVTKHRANSGTSNTEHSHGDTGKPLHGRPRPLVKKNSVPAALPGHILPLVPPGGQTDGGEKHLMSSISVDSSNEPPAPPPRPHGRSMSVDWKHPPAVPPRVSPKDPPSIQKLAQFKHFEPIQSQEVLNIIPGSSASPTVAGIDPGSTGGRDTRGHKHTQSVDNKLLAGGHDTHDGADSSSKAGVAWDLLGDFVDGSAEFALAAQRQANRDKKDLHMAIRTHKERNSMLTRLNSELNQELQEVMEQRIALEIQLEHLRPFSS